MGTTESKEQININENLNSSAKTDGFSLGNLVLIIIGTSIILTALIIYILKLLNNHLKEYVNKKINRINISTA